uniref:Phytocyanin domain-containing protein n=1 Tax=Arundo donax TaxID=35708 RepID=A0A0A9CX20_ARUDO
MTMASSFGLGLACFVLLVAAAGATQYKVGGDNGWAVPDASAESFNTWAEKTSFQIGDQLLFVYPKDKDSVLLVEPGDYNACNTSSYDKKFDDGSTAFTLDRSGAFFFISGVEANCRANEKLIVMVSAGGNASAPAPAGQGSPSTPAPSNGGGGGAQVQAPPSSPNAPAAKNSTAKGSPPAAGNDKNGAGLTVAGFVASVVGCIAYATLAF